MNAQTLAALEPSSLRSMLPAFLASYIGDPAAAARCRAAIETIVRERGDDALHALLVQVSTLGQEQRVYPADALCRVLSREWTRHVITQGTLAGVAHLVEAARGPTVVLCNHLSYLDTIAMDSLLAWNGHHALADRVVTVAGPKVYEDLFRLVAAAALNTLPAPQSASLGHTAQLTPRELARRVMASLQAAHEAVAHGFVLQLYPEGSRSRTGRLRPFLKGVHRYLDLPHVSIVPAAITGTDRIFSVDTSRVVPGPVHLSFGAPLHLTADGGSRDALARARDAVASLLPSTYQPDPADPVLQ